MNIKTIVMNIRRLFAIFKRSVSVLACDILGLQVISTIVVLNRVVWNVSDSSFLDM